MVQSISPAISIVYQLVNLYLEIKKRQALEFTFFWYQNYAF